MLAIPQEFSLFLSFSPLICTSVGHLPVILPGLPLAPSLDLSVKITHSVVKPYCSENDGPSMILPPQSNRVGLGHCS